MDTQEPFEQSPEWQRWRETLQVDVPENAKFGMSSAVQDFCLSIREEVQQPSKQFPAPTSRYYRWPAIGLVSGLVVGCLASLFFSSRSTLVTDTPSIAHHSLAIESPPPLPSTMVSLTSPNNTVLSHSSIRNPSFEEPFNGLLQPEAQPIPGWFFPAQCRAAGYRVEVDTSSYKTGRKCLVIESVVDQPSMAGNVIQTLDATGYRGKTIRLTAAIRAEVADEWSQAHVWLRVDNDDSSISFFDSTKDRPIRTNQWQYVEIVGTVSSRAQFINLGAFLVGGGTVWVDDFHLEVLP